LAAMWCAFLLFCILLCLCKPLRTAVGVLFWIIVILMWWHWPSTAAAEQLPPQVLGHWCELREPMPRCSVAVPRAAHGSGYWSCVRVDGTTATRRDAR
jgi:hypothetical protein